jgi:hypothetical protein
MSFSSGAGATLSFELNFSGADMLSLFTWDFIPGFCDNPFGIFLFDLIIYKEPITTKIEFSSWIESNSSNLMICFFKSYCIEKWR